MSHMPWPRRLSRKKCEWCHYVYSRPVNNLPLLEDKLATWSPASLHSATLRQFQPRGRRISQKPAMKPAHLKSMISTKRKMATHLLMQSPPLHGRGAIGDRSHCLVDWNFLSHGLRAICTHFEQWHKGFITCVPAISFNLTSLHMFIRFRGTIPKAMWPMTSRRTCA